MYWFALLAPFVFVGFLLYLYWDSFYFHRSFPFVAFLAGKKAPSLKQQAFVSRLAYQARFSEAQLLALDARYPSSPGALEFWAQLAQDARDGPELVRRAERVRFRFPNELRGYLMGIAGLQMCQRDSEAEVLAAAAIKRFPDSPAPLVEHGMLVQKRGDWAEVRSIFHRAQARFPSNARGYIAECMLLLNGPKAFDEAEAVIGKALARFPDDQYVAQWFAETAHRRCDWPTAIVRWAQFRTKFEGQPDGYIRGSEALRSAGKFDEALALINLARVVFPKNQAVQRAAEAAARAPQSGMV